MQIEIGLAEKDGEISYITIDLPAVPMAGDTLYFPDDATYIVQQGSIYWTLDTENKLQKISLEAVRD